MKNEKFLAFVSLLNQKTNYTFDTQSVGRKGHSIFILK